MHDDLDIGATGEFSPYLKFNAKTKEWSWRGRGRRDRSRSSPGSQWIWPTSKRDGCVSTKAQRRTGRSTRLRATAPSGRANGTSAASSSRILGRTSFKGAGEFSSNAVGVCSAVRELYRDFKAQAPGHPGEVPIVAVTGMDCV